MNKTRKHFYNITLLFTFYQLINSTKKQIVLEKWVWFLES